MSKLVTYAELKEHSNKNSLYILLHEKGTPSFIGIHTVDSSLGPIVYDVTKFIDEVRVLVSCADLSRQLTE